MSSTPSTSELLLLGAPVAARDGSRIRVRQIRSSDKALLQRSFERLSEESRYRRFLSPTPELSESMLSYLTEVDHHDHVAIVALDEATGEGVGVARYVRSGERPETAEVAVTVIDDWQGRGVGTLLLDVLAARAREEGISSFTALMLASNREMIELLERLGPVRIVHREGGTVAVEAPVRAGNIPPSSEICFGFQPARTRPFHLDTGWVAPPGGGD
jgi:GNAT superfamily N-acetyltransferase